MKPLGLFSLGIVVGSIIATGVNNTTRWKDSDKLVASFVGAAVAGAVPTFIGKAGISTWDVAVQFYPLGLAYGWFWFYTPGALQNLASPDSKIRVVGALHVAALVLSVVLGVLLFLSPEFRNRLPQ